MNEEQICCSIGTVGRENQNTEEGRGQQGERKERRETEEIWKDIVGFEGRYRISSIGNVFSIKRKKMLNPTSHNARYFRISLRNETGKKNLSIHTLVATHFIEKPDGKQVLDHIDRNKLNNNVANLRYLTPAENNVNADCIGYTINRYGRYRVAIGYKRKNVSLGSFKTIDEAKNARRDAIKKYYPNVYASLYEKIKVEA